MTETPRTDHHYKDHYKDMHDHITVEFARGLERELNACRRALAASEAVLRRAIDGDSFMAQVTEALGAIEAAKSKCNPSPTTAEATRDQENSPDPQRVTLS